MTDDIKERHVGHADLRDCETIDDVVAKVAGAIDEFISGDLIESADQLRARGGTTQEVEHFVEQQAAAYAECRATKLAELRAWLERDGETLQ